MRAISAHIGDRRVLVPLVVGPGAEVGVVGEVGLAQQQPGNRDFAVEIDLLDELLGELLTRGEAQAEAVALTLEGHIALERVALRHVRRGRIAAPHRLRLVAWGAERGTRQLEVVAIPHDVLERLPRHRHARGKGFANEGIVAELLGEVRQRHIQSPSRHRSNIAAHLHPPAACAGRFPFQCAARRLAHH